MVVWFSKMNNKTIEGCIDTEFIKPESVKPVNEKNITQALTRFCSHIITTIFTL